jgi:O-antigen ligase
MAAYNVLLTNTRAAIITLLVVIVLIVLTGLLRVRPSGVIAVAVLALISLVAMPPALYKRAFDITNYTVERSATLRVRLIYWRAAMSIFADHPVLGIGVGNQSEVPRRVTEIPMPPNSSVHNEYLESLLETGLVGYPLIVAFVVSLYHRCRNAERYFRAENDPQTRFLLVSARVGLLTVLFYAVQCDVLHFPLKGWWLTMGVIVGLSELARGGRRSQADEASVYA